MGKKAGFNPWQRPNGTWMVQVRAGRDGFGKQIRHTLSDTTYEGLYKRWLQLQANLSAGKRAKIKGRTVQDFLDEWIENTIKLDMKPRTYVCYRGIVRNHLNPRIGRLQLRDLTAETVQRLLAKMAQEGISPRNRQLTHDVLQKALNQAVRFDLVAKNVCHLVDRPRAKAKIFDIFSQEETDAFLKASRDDRFYALYCLALGTGMRQGELFALHWSDIDLKAGAIFVRYSLIENLDGNLERSVTKTKSSARRIRIPRLFHKVLIHHRERMLAEGHAGPWVFCDSNGGPLRANNFGRRSFKPLIKKAGVKQIRFHDLRHTCATMLLIKGTHPKVVQELLGHASIKITMDTYSHVIPTLLDNAADVLDSLLGAEGLPGHPQSLDESDAKSA